MQDANCVFCKIIKKELPAEIVFENDCCTVFLSINPINHGHALVVPKEHYENFEQTPDSVLVDMLVTGKKVAKAVVKASGCEGFVFSTNNGSAAGQAVMHTHFHIIPRFKKDGLFSWPDKSVSGAELRDMRNKTVKFL